MECMRRSKRKMHPLASLVEFFLQSKNPRPNSFLIKQCKYLAQMALLNAELNSDSNPSPFQVILEISPEGQTPQIELLVSVAGILLLHTTTWLQYQPFPRIFKTLTQIHRYMHIHILSFLLIFLSTLSLPPSLLCILITKRKCK